MAVNLRLMSGIGFAVGIIACAVTWLVMSEASPMNDYFLHNPSMRNFVGMLNFPVFIVATLFRLPDSINVAIFLTFLQWFVLGFLASIILGLLVPKKSQMPE